MQKVLGKVKRVLLTVSTVECSLGASRSHTWTSLLPAGSAC